MAAIGRLTQLVLECRDGEQLARFWQSLLDTDDPYGDPDWLTIDWEPVGRLSFHAFDEYAPPVWPGETGEAQTHLDLLVDDLTEATGRVLAAGGRPLTDVINPGPRAWRVFADPAGHPFCLVSVPE